MSAMAVDPRIDIGGLPEPVFIATGFDEILEEMLALYESHIGSRPQSGTRDYNFLAILAYRENLVRIGINDAARQNLLAFAGGDKLDYIGSQLGVDRLPAASATTTVRFTFDALLSSPLAIPASTLVLAPGGSVSFRTDTTETAPIGSEYIDVAATCTSPGSAGNGWPAGALTQLAAPIAHVTSVGNLSSTTGGADPESDDAYRLRIYIAPEQFSTAGSRRAYEYWARTAHPDIVDVHVWSPAPGQVRVVPLLSGGVAVDVGTVELVQAAVSAADRRPLTDSVIVSAPTVVAYTIEMRVWVTEAFEHTADDVVSGVESALSALAGALRSELGADVVPEQIIADAHTVGGVYRAVCDEPEYISVGLGEVASATTITVTYVGVA